MNEMLSKGKRIDNGEWVEGFYICLNEKEHRIYTGYAETDCGDYYPDYYIVDPKTVCHYTGLPDKNGRKVFSNEIVMFGFAPCVIKWDAPNARYMFYENGKYLRNGFNEDTMKSKEIVGNVFDNPKLLKGV